MIGRAAARFILPLVVGAMACRNSRERARLDFERMRVQQRYDLYGRSAIFANGQSMQAPPPGTITRESVEDTGIVGTGMSGGRQVETSPVALTPAQIILGQQKFSIYCAVCHGAGGFGGSIVAENMGTPRPPSLRSDSMLARPDGYIFTVATHGIGRMPSYAIELTPAERWAVVAYIRQLQQSRVITAEQRADSTRAVAIRVADSSLAAARRP
jgi:mono/diheme cytochrome c family protein